MVVGGVPETCENHAERVLNVSIGERGDETEMRELSGMLMESKLVQSPITRKPIKIRIGVHSGPVVAGVVGMKMPRYFPRDRGLTRLPDIVSLGILSTWPTKWRRVESRAGSTSRRRPRRTASAPIPAMSLPTEEIPK